MAVISVFPLLAVLFRAANGHVVCHQAWTLHEGSCYALVNIHMTCSSAQAFCQSFDARLAEPNTESENSFVKHLIQNRNAAGVWIGGIDAIQEGTWQWASTLSRIYPYVGWRDGEPNNFGGNEHCMWLSRHGWYDGNCKEEFPFICEYRIETLRTTRETEIRLIGLEDESDQVTGQGTL